MATNIAVSGDRMKRIAVLIPAILTILTLAACGGGGGSPNTPTSGAKNRAFISNTYTGNLQIVDTQTDTTPLTAQTVDFNGQVVPGQPITITVSTDVTFEVESPDHTTTMVYDPTSRALWFVTNSSESAAGDIPIDSGAGMALFSPDSTTVYVPEPNLSLNGTLGGVERLDRASSSVSAQYSVPSARYAAISPDGNTLLAFADNSDSVFLINVSATSPSVTEIPGFARPVNAFFSSDSNTAYVINCGPECGSSNPASVSSLDIPSQTIKATVPVGGASVGYLNGTTLYVAGSPVPPGTSSTYDAVDVSSMTRITTNSVAIGDGFHTTMALSSNNKLYIGAKSCSNTTTGCLSVVDVGSNTAAAPLPPRGAITSLLAIKGRNVMYAIEGGFLNIYNTDTNQLQGTQITFTGALYGIVQVDQ